MVTKVKHIADDIISTGHLDPNASLTFVDLTLTGNLTVQGTTTTLDTANLNVEDKNITLNYGTGDTSSGVNGAGITIQDAVDASNNATLLWDASDDEFDFSHAINIPNLKVSGAQGSDGQVLTSTGSGVAWEAAAGGVDGIVSSANATAITIDSSENVGIGRAPESDYYSSLSVLALGNSSTIYASTSGNPNLTFNDNLFINSSGNNEYQTSHPGTRLEQFNGTLTFNNAPSGTAGQTATLTERFRIDSSGNVGIGNASPSSFYAGATNLVIGSGSGDEGMTIYSDTVSRLHFADGTSGGAQYAGFVNYVHTDDSAGTNTGAFHIGAGGSGSTQVVIDANGYMGLGDTTPDSRLKIEAADTTHLANFNNTGSGGSHHGIRVNTNSSSSWNQLNLIGGGAKFGVTGDSGVHIFHTCNTGESNGQPDLGKSSRGGIHFDGAPSSGTSRGITFEASDGNTQAGIVCHNNGADGTHLGFFTTYTYAGGPQCNMKLTNYGTVVVGASTDIGSVTPASSTSVHSNYGDILCNATNNDIILSDLLPGYSRGSYATIKATGSYMYFSVNGAYSHYLASSGGLTASDGRLKENVSTLTNSLSKVKQLRGVNFTWKDTEKRGSENNIGFIAQEVETIYPELVGDGGLPQDESGQDPMKAVNYEKLVPVLVEAIKELEARVAQLEG